MEPSKPVVQITYCTQCHWLLRAAWLAQELLSTFEAQLGGVLLTPGTGGIFEVSINGTTLWSRALERRFPEAKELKQRVRDAVDPSFELGHAEPR